MREAAAALLAFAGQRTTPDRVWWAAVEHRIDPIPKTDIGETCGS